MTERQLDFKRSPLVVFGGIYSNLEALRALKAHCDQEKIPAKNIIHTGDAVAYGADPQAVLDELCAWGVHSLAGNVEIQLAEDLEDCGCGFREGSVCDSLSQRWYPYAKSQMRSRDLEWMATLPQHFRFELGGYRCVVVHGTFSKTSGYVFRSTPWEVKSQEMEKAQADVILGGHCGVPFLDSRDGKVWANSGALGLPANDGTPRVWALKILWENPGELKFETFAIEYDHEGARRKMLAVPALTAYAETLKTGRWPSCEILPADEVGQTGVALKPETLELISKLERAKALNKPSPGKPRNKGSHHKG